MFGSNRGLLEKDGSMSVTLPTITAKMGVREYFITKMTAFELSGQVSVASELSDWSQLTLEELYQRDLNERRVLDDIAPYLANSPGRFFGSIIVWILDEAVATFEPVSNFVEVRAAYARAAKSLGFLVLDAGDRKGGLVALDGQHRLAALRAVVQGKVEGPYRGEVSNDEIAVIFVKDSNVRDARDLFTVLNRSARKVSKNDVLIMGEVDGSAIVARRLAGSSLLAPHGLDDSPLVKWESNTMGARDKRFTTLNALYDVCNSAASVLGIDPQSGEETGTPPSGEDLDAIERVALKWLGMLFAAIGDLEAMRHDPDMYVEARKASEPYSLLLRPVGLGVFFSAVATVLRQGALDSDRAGSVIGHLASLGWSLEDPSWAGILVNKKGNVTNKRADVALGADLAAWLCAAAPLDSSFVSSLLLRYRRHFGDPTLDLPTHDR